MNGWSSKSLVVTPQAVVSGVVTNLVIAAADGYPITAGGSIHHVLKIVTSGTTVVGSITAKLQTSIGSDWQDSKTVTLSGNGVFYIKLLAEVSGDQQYLPLLNKGRVVLTTTNAGDAVTIVSVDVLQEL